MQPPPKHIYKLCPSALWRAALAAGTFHGSPRDAQDGFIHCSTAQQLPETARKYYAGQDDLLLLTIDAAALGGSLKYEPSRGGDLFPHIYGDLPLTAVTNVTPFDVIE